MPFAPRSLRALLCGVLITTASCTRPEETGGTGGSSGDSAIPRGDSGLPPVLAVPAAPDMTPNNEAKARGFQLYYKERVSRAVLAYNRFSLFGDVNFGVTNGRSHVAKTGNTYDVVVGPKDNNRMGTAAWMLYEAYEVFPTREIELTLIRMFNGLAFFEEVSGHPGMTAREVYPGWTRVVDGTAATVTRTRNGAPVVHPEPPDATLEAEIINAFFAGTVFTYREDPEEFYLNILPALRPGDWAVTKSFMQLPKLLPASDCCSTLLRTPAPYKWEGAYWGNHNSRDNFPDLILGILAAQGIVASNSAPTELKAAAARAVAAGNRIGDLILANNTALMTVQDQDPYDTIAVSGTVRPHGASESQDLGSLGICSMAYLAQAVTSEGLSSQVPTIPLPSSIDRVLFAPLDGLLECELPEEAVCTGLDQAFCSKTWATFQHILFEGEPILEFFEDNITLAPIFLSAFQNDLDDVVESMLVVLRYARVSGNAALEANARDQLFQLTYVQQKMADLAFYNDEGERLEARYQAALYQAQGHLPAATEDFADFARAEAQVGYLEGLLTRADTTEAPLLTEADIAAEVQDELADTTIETVLDRYENTYGDTPPFRVVSGAYEARGSDLVANPWRPVERPRHFQIGGIRLLHEVPLCIHAPHILDCTWAKLGCERPDLDNDGAVGVNDRTLFDAAMTTHSGAACNDANAWCDGADLDRDAQINATDDAFMTAADGCSY